MRSVGKGHAAGQTHSLLADYFAIEMAQERMRRADPLVASHHFIALCVHGTHQQMLLGLTPNLAPAQIRQTAELGVAAFMRAYAPG